MRLCALVESRLTIRIVLVNIQVPNGFLLGVSWSAGDLLVGVYAAGDTDLWLKCDCSDVFGFLFNILDTGGVGQVPYADIGVFVLDVPLLQADLRDIQRAQVFARDHAVVQSGQELHVLLVVCALCGLFHQSSVVHGPIFDADGGLSTSGVGLSGCEL